MLPAVCCLSQARSQASDAWLLTGAVPKAAEAVFMGNFSEESCSFTVVVKETSC